MAAYSTTSNQAPDVPPPAYTPTAQPQPEAPSSSSSQPFPAQQPVSSLSYATFPSSSKGPQVQPQPDPYGQQKLPDVGGFQPTGRKVLTPSAGPAQGRTVYYYRNIQTGQTLTSFLPPDHPRSLCLQHGHLPLTTHGILGILAAVIFFPLGVLCCFMDRRVVCGRCGEVLSDGCL